MLLLHASNFSPMLAILDTPGTGTSDVPKVTASTGFASVAVVSVIAHAIVLPKPVAIT